MMEKDIDFPRLRIAFIWHRLGPYHMARLRAAASLGAPIIAVEMSAMDAVYAWDRVTAADGFERVTLFTDDCDSMHPRDVARRVVRTLDQVRPDVLFCPGWGANYSIAALNWSLSAKIPAVLMTESARADRPRSAATELLKRSVVKHFGAALVGGTRHADYVNKLGIPRDRIFHGYDVVDNQHFAAGAEIARDLDAQSPAERERLRLPPRFWLTSCRFIAKKNITTLLRSYARCVGVGGSRNSMPKLVILGDGPLRGQLTALSQELKLEDQVLMAGFKQYAELPAYYGLAEAFILPSTTEQWGLVVNEAMASGLPVIVSERCNCSVDLVKEGVNGFTFNPFNIESLASVLLKFGSKSDRERAIMGDRSVEIIREYSPAAFGSGIRASTLTAIGHPQPRRSIKSRIVFPVLAARKNAVDV